MRFSELIAAVSESDESASTAVAAPTAPALTHVSASTGDSPQVAAPTRSDAELVTITDDSRHVTRGALFVAVRGTLVDGHDFVADACTRGAAAIVCERPLALNSSIPQHIVPDAAAWIARAASVWHGVHAAQRAGRFAMIGVTGTNGKTTVATMTQAMLRHANRPAALLGTVGCDLIGRCLTTQMTTPPPIELADMLGEAYRAGARAAVMEVSSHSLQQRRTAGLRFDVGVFTNLSGDHLDYHGTMEAYAAAKRRLFEGLDARAAAAVNADDPVGETMAGACRGRVIRFGLSDRAELRGAIRAMTARGSTVEVELDGRRATLVSPLIGRHNVLNSLAAIGAGVALGLDLDAACAGVGSLGIVRGRLERVDTNEPGFTVVVDYAHTDDALRNVLSALRPLTAGRLWCVFGCGGDRDRTKRPRMARAALEGADGVVVTSDNPRSESPESILADIRTGMTDDEAARCRFEVDRAAAIDWTIQNAAATDTVLIAGKGHEDYQIIGTRRIHFDDAEVAAAAIAKRQGA
jgi:UDP-N-acetylmuramoyl-L-alanyl-D-glutamate--2,6-diaminopimelate ligase